MATQSKHKTLADIPSFAKARKDLKGIVALGKAEPFFGPVLALLGGDRQGFREALRKALELGEQANRLATLPDEFNTTFAQRGWIMHSSMDHGLAIQALELAKAGKLGEAESVLVEMHDEDYLRRSILRVSHLEAFKPRVPLLEAALQDHLAERYHASVPVLLLLLDGAVGHALRDKGFFAKGADLNAWDSIEAHDLGLGALVKTMTAMRQTTRTEPISIPYRHGIMHGMDLGYANRAVSTKAFAALIAASELVRKIEAGEREAPPPQAEPTLHEVLRRFRRVQQDKERLAKWTPRAVIVGQDIPNTGGADEYPPGSPEAALVQYLEYWQAKNFGLMSDYWTSPGQKTGRNVRAPVVRERLGPISLVGFQLARVEDKGLALTEIAARVDLESEEHGRKTVDLCFRLVLEDGNGEVGFDRTCESVAWKVANWDEASYAIWST